MNNFDSAQIPPYITALVAELEHQIEAATAAGVNDADGERSRSHQDEIRAQLRALGWDATLADSRHWLPIPSGFTILHNLPDPFYYPQRCYRVPEGPGLWHHLWDGERIVRFLTWGEAYTFVFTYLTQEQAELPLLRYRVRPPFTWGGRDYMATSAEQALHLHLHYWLSLGWVTVPQAVALTLRVFQHCENPCFYCSACQFAPCTYTEQVPLPPEPC